MYVYHLRDGIIENVKRKGFRQIFIEMIRPNINIIIQNIQGEKQLFFFATHIMHYIDNTCIIIIQVDKIIKYVK